MEDVKTVRAHLGELESEDLLRIADELGELTAHPGWVQLELLLSRYVASVEVRAAKDAVNVTTLAASLDDLIRREQARAVAAGRIDGVWQVGAILQMVKQLAVDVRSALDAAD